jgi:hypothetical protein
MVAGDLEATKLREHLHELALISLKFSIQTVDLIKFFRYLNSRAVLRSSNALSVTCLPFRHALFC